MYGNCTLTSRYFFRYQIILLSSELDYNLLYVYNHIILLIIRAINSIIENDKILKDKKLFYYRNFLQKNVFCVLSDRNN